MKTITENDVTSGSLLRVLARLTTPMLISALLQNVQSLIDLFWVGRLGADAVAALAMCGTIIMMIFPMLMGAATGTVALVSRAIGEDDPDRASHAAAQSILLAAAMSVVTAAAGLTVMQQLFPLLGASPEVTERGRVYLAIVLGGSFSMNILFLANSAMQGAGNTVIPMCGLVLSNLLNMALDPVLIFGLFGLPRMGVAGAALATVLAQLVACTLVVGLLMRGRAGLKIRAPHWRLDLPLQWRLLRVGVPSSGQMLSRSLMSLVMMRIVAGCGTAAVAAYGIVWRFHMILLMPAFALGNAAATVVGQNLGARRPGRAARGAWLATGLDALWMAVAALLLCWQAPRLLCWFSDTAAVVEVGTSFLRTVAPFFVFAAPAIVLGRGMQGAGNTVPPMVITLVSLWVLQVPLAVALSRAWEPATQGVWWAMAAASTANGLMTALWFARGRWKRCRV